MRRYTAKTRGIALFVTLLLLALFLPGCAQESEGLGSTDGYVNSPVPSHGEGLYFHPRALAIARRDVFEYPYMGLTAVFSNTLLDALDSGNVIAFPSAEYRPGNTFDYAAMCWYAVDESQKNVTVENVNDYVKNLAQIGVLGVYKNELNLDLSLLTGCTEHRELGKSPDGAFTYVLSLSDAAGEALKQAFEETEITISQMLKVDLYNGIDAFSEAREDTSNIGELNLVDINGNAYTSDLFREYDLTLVNVLTTWCSYCVEEMPVLEKLKQDMAAQGVNVVGVVFDTVSEEGKTREDVVELAKILQERAELTIPLLLPDETDMNGRLKGISAFPESFFVDKEGNIVGEPIMGAKSYDVWKSLVEEMLAEVRENES